MSRWTSRLDKLRELIGGRDGCPECGRGSDGPVVVTSTAWGDPKPEPCQVCGAEALVVTFGPGKPNDARWRG